MSAEIVIKEDVIEKAVLVNAKIIEFDAPYDKNYFAKRYQGKKHLILAAYYGKELAGYLVAYDRDNDGSFYCWMAGVDPEFRRKGILTSLMNYLVDWTKTQGYQKIKITTRNRRRAMLSYLVKQGFYFTGVEEREKIEDFRIFLEKTL